MGGVPVYQAGFQGLTFRVIHTGIEGYPGDRRVSLYKSARYRLVQGVAYAVELVA
jgi:hypothetical protein